MKKIIFILTLILTFSSLSVYGEEIVEEDQYLTEKAVIVEAGPIEDNNIDSFDGGTQFVTAKVLSGKYKDELFEIQNDLSNNEVYDIVVEKGDKVVVMIEEYEDNTAAAFISDYYRVNYTLYLAIIFAVLLLVIGRLKGLKAIISLALTMASILYILLPAILKGANPIPISIMISIGVTIITIFLIGGINKKSISTIIGTISGVVIAGLISYYIGTKIKLTGLHAEEAGMLMHIPQGISFSFKNLLFSGIILGALGAIMDVGMSVSSSIDEIHKANNNLSQKELFKSGMNVGKDIMGTMTNTLILAYAGSSIPVLLLFMAYETSITKILNLDIIATEIIRSLSGSIGLILTIPITALVASFLIKKNKKESSEN
ncbi:MAG: YibE/F family protein [Tissierella sp.]|uniref:YibE/F family protein n=1 Tax=Tissierella sp. TaxID=41274 RepID=UPI003F99706E